MLRKKKGYPPFEKYIKTKRRRRETEKKKIRRERKPEFRKCRNENKYVDIVIRGNVTNKYMSNRI